MIERQIPIEHVAPWLVSSVSGCYIIVRTRRLSRAEPSSTPLFHFLLRQADVILMLCSGPAIWYFTQIRRRSEAKKKERVCGRKARAIHQLRQVFTALLIGTGLMARKAAAGKTAELAVLAPRLNKIVHDGIDSLAVLGELYPSDLLDEHGAPLGRNAANDRASA